MMKQDIKNKEPQERLDYVPASVKVVNVTAQRIICTSPNGNTEGLDESPFTNW